MLSYYSLVPLAFLLSFVCVWLILRLPASWIALDRPNNRSLHQTPTPRLGGVAILAGIMLPFGVYCFLGELQSDFVFILISLILVAAISLVDDFYSISFLIRITIHIIAAILIVNSGHAITDINTDWGGITLSVYIAVPTSILFIVWMINLYNFMDGIDGLAGGMAVIGFGTFATIGIMEGDFAFAISALVITSSVLGFLFWNYPPARIFMGDSGSSSLGLLAAAFSLWADVNELIPIWMSVVIFSPFIVDATVTLIIRIIKRERFWDAHKSHHYQLVAESGMSRRKLLLIEYMLMLVCSIVAIFSYDASIGLQISGMLVLAILFLILMRYARKISV